MLVLQHMHAADCSCLAVLAETRSNCVAAAVPLLSTAAAAHNRSIGADMLIDDNVGYALDCADAGIQVLLYDWEDSYPWSKLPEG